MQPLNPDVEDPKAKTRTITPVEDVLCIITFQLFNDLKKTTNILCINPCRCPVHIPSAITIFCANLLNFPPTAPLSLCLRVFLTCVT